MNRNNLWRFIVVVLVVVWALFEIYPPTNQDLVQVFREQARLNDLQPAQKDTFGKIVEQAAACAKIVTNQPYSCLLDAIGTNDITPYFPQFTKEGQTHPTTHILNAIQREAMGKIHLGIDLKGGSSFLVEMDTNNLVNVETFTNNLGAVETRTNVADVPGALSQAVEVLRKRVDRFGVAEPLIQPQGNNRILIELPGLSQAQMDQVKETLQKVAFLEFRLVSPDSDTALKEGSILPGFELLSMARQVNGTNAPPERMFVKRKAEMVGGVKYAGLTRDETGQPEISFSLDSAATETFGRITRENVGHRLAIVLDGELQSAPNIKSPIENGSGVITLGNGNDQEAHQLINVLQNPLKAPVHIIGQNAVQPTLGQDTIRSGIKASVIGIVAVSLFMLCYYFLAGAVANVALITNIIILFGIICMNEQTLTLPGIAGLVLTVGMAVDANVLIYERIREERSKGKSLRGAISAGYDRAFGTIFDSHVTTLISAVILWKLGTGSVQGFGFSLTWGVAASLFTSLVVTRLIFDWMLSKNLIKELKMLHLIPATMQLNFMKLAVPAFVASWLLILIGNSYGIFVRGHDVLGVDFSGGETITLSVDKQHEPAVDTIRDVAHKASNSDALVTYQSDLGTGVHTLRVTVRAFSTSEQVSVGDKVFNALKEAFPDAGFGSRPLSSDSVGPVVGEEIVTTAVVASLLAMFGILIYVAFRYEFSFAVGAIVAIIHDILMTLGWYFLTGRELNATMVAAILTIIGFSINDTIVIFDRIREDLKLGVRGSFKELMNKALNQTLSRTIITSGTVFLATLSLYIFGGGPINDFAFTFLVGIITGTYSSIYIASAIVLWWHKGQRPKIGSAQVIVEPNAPAAR